VQAAIGLEAAQRLGGGRSEPARIDRAGVDASGSEPAVQVDDGGAGAALAERQLVRQR
jgi:hypothetical protein